MFVTHNDPVYEGMIVGLAPKPGDMIINVMKGKQLNKYENTRVLTKM
jgi:GTP-binding protein